MKNTVLAFTFSFFMTVIMYGEIHKDQYGLSSNDCENSFSIFCSYRYNTFGSVSTDYMSAKAYFNISNMDLKPCFNSFLEYNIHLQLEKLKSLEDFKKELIETERSKFLTHETIIIHDYLIKPKKINEYYHKLNFSSLEDSGLKFRF